MKKYSALFLILFLITQFLFAQDIPKVKWYFAPEASGMIHDDHLGRAVGLQAGVSLFKERLQVGFVYVGRSGPINPHTETLTLPEGTDYKGQSVLQVRADHALTGLVISPQFQLSPTLTLDIPIILGTLGAGFFLTDEDRLTPDGRRVSEWENELMGNQDASFGIAFEGGIRVRKQLREGISAGIGVHYAQSSGWDTFIGGTDYYNVPRVSIFFLFGN
ncbi:MAG: hypothetical protein AAFU33_09075 [Bacteroidota bacterium]